jgi:hypothetical protein
MATKSLPLKVERKLWRPTPATTSLVITLPRVDFLKKGDVLEISVDKDEKITMVKKKVQA